MKYKIFGEWKIEVEADSYQDATNKVLNSLPDCCVATGFEQEIVNNNPNSKLKLEG